MHDPAIVVMLLPKFILSLLFGAGGAYLFFLGLTGVLRKWRLLVNAASTSGTVVAYDAVLRRSTDDRGRDEEITYYYPIVEFMDSIGMERRATVSFGSTPKEFPEGAAVTVIYYRNDPGHAEIKGFGELLSDSIALMAGGMFFMTIVVIVWAFDIPVKFG